MKISEAKNHLEEFLLQIYEKFMSLGPFKFFLWLYGNIFGILFTILVYLVVYFSKDYLKERYPQTLYEYVLGKPQLAWVVFVLVCTFFVMFILALFLTFLSYLVTIKMKKKLEKNL